MTKEELNTLIEKIRRKYPNNYHANGLRIDAEELDRYAGQIELNLDIYTDNELFEDELDVLSDIKELFEEVDNWKWNYDE